MSIYLTRQGDDLEIHIGKLSIVVHGRYRRHLHSITKSRTTPHTYQIELNTNLDIAIKEVMEEIPKKEKRRLLNESMKMTWP